MASCSFLAFSAYCFVSFSQFFLSPMGQSFLPRFDANFSYSFMDLPRSSHDGEADLSPWPIFLCRPFLPLTFFIISSIAGVLSSANSTPANTAARIAVPVRIFRIAKLLRWNDQVLAGLRSAAQHRVGPLLVM